MSETRRREFTGRHMAIAISLFFGTIIAVNFTMAYLASSSFAGLVVANSYVESQRFNGRLEAMRSQAALGWEVDLAVSREAVTVDVRDAGGRPVAVTVDVEMTRPTTDDDDHKLHGVGLGAADAAESGTGRVAMPTALAPGVWDATATIQSDDGNVYLAARRVTLPADAPSPQIKKAGATETVK